MEPLWMWLVFLTVIVSLLVLDLGVFHKKEKKIEVKESLWMSLFYITIAFIFGLFIWYQMGIQSFAEYLTGYLIEKSLSLDNIFVISLIFSSLSIPSTHQYRVLFWGILGVIFLRGIMIALGVQLITHFAWVLYIFAIFMIVTGIKMLFIAEKPIDINQNIILQWLRRHFKITETIEQQKFLVKRTDPLTKKSTWFMTPLLVALIVIECVDVIFAVDSVPAIFAITNNPYIIYTSNIFAILGLRALYFALAAILGRFHYLKTALALVLIFIGLKVFIAHFLGIEKFPPLISLGVTIGLLAFGCFYSIYKPYKPKSK